MYLTQGIDGFDHVTTFKLVWLAYHYEGMSRSLMSVLLWWRRRHGLQALFVELDARFYTDHIMPYEHAARKLVNGLLASSCITLLVLVAFICYGLFTTNPQITDVYHTAMLPYSEPMDAGDYKGLFTSDAVFCVAACAGIIRYVERVAVRCGALRYGMARHVAFFSAYHKTPHYNICGTVRRLAQRTTPQRNASGVNFDSVDFTVNK